MNCMKGGFIHQRHNSIRNLFSDMFSIVHNDVEIEPQLLPLTGETLPRGSNTTEEARCDVSVRGFWQDGQRAFFDVKVFNPFAQSHLQTPLTKNFEACERDKKRKYNTRVIQIEHGSFSPLVFTPYG